MSAPQADVPSLAARSRELGLGSLVPSNQTIPSNVPTRGKVAAAIALVRAKQAAQSASPLVVRVKDFKDLSQFKKAKETDQPSMTSSLSSRETLARHGLKSSHVISTGNHSLASELHYQARSPLSPKDQSLQDTTTVGEESDKESGSFIQNLFTSRSQAKGSSCSTALPNLPSGDDDESCDKDQENAPSYSYSSSQSTATRSANFNICDKVEQIRTLRSVKSGTLKATESTASMQPQSNSVRSERTTSVRSEQSGYTVPAPPSLSFDSSSDSDSDAGVDPNTLLNVSQFLDKIDFKSKYVDEANKQQPKTDRIEEVRAKETDLEQIDTEEDDSTTSSNDDGVNLDTLAEIGAYIDAIASPKNASEAAPYAGMNEFDSDDESSIEENEVPPETQFDVLSFIESLEKKKKNEVLSVSPSIPSVLSMTDTEDKSEAEQVPQKAASEAGSILYTNSNDSCESLEKKQNETPSISATIPSVPSMTDTEQESEAEQVPEKVASIAGSILYTNSNDSCESLEKKQNETPSISATIPSVPSMTDTEQESEAEQVPEKVASIAGSILYTNSSDSCGIPKPCVESIYQKLQPVPQGANIDPPASDPYYVSDKADPPTPNDVVEELMRMREAASSDGLAPSYSVETLDSESTFNTEAAVSFTHEEKKDADDDDANSEASLASSAYDSFATEVKQTLESRKKLSYIVELECKDSAESDDAATFGLSVCTANGLSPVAECGASKEEESDEEKGGLVSSLEEGVIDLTKYEVEGNTIVMAENEEVQLLGSVPPPPKPESLAREKKSTDPQEVEARESVEYQERLLDALDTQPCEESAYHADKEGKDTKNLAPVGTEGENKSVADKIVPKDSFDLVRLEKESSNLEVENADSYASANSGQVKALVTETDATSDGNPLLHGTLSQDSSEIILTDLEGTRTLESSGGLATCLESEGNAVAAGFAQDVTQICVVDEGDEGFELMDMVPEDMLGRGYESESSAPSIIHPPATHRKVNPKNELDPARTAVALLTGKKDTTQHDGYFVQCGPSVGEESVVDKADEEPAERGEVAQLSEERSLGEDAPSFDQRKVNPKNELDPARTAVALLTGKKDTTQHDGYIMQCGPRVGEESVVDKVDEEPAERGEEAQLSEERSLGEDAPSYDDWSEMPSEIGTAVASTKSAGPDDFIESMRSDDDTFEENDSDTPKGSLKINEAFRDKPSLFDGTDASDSKNAQQSIDEDDSFINAFLSASETVDTAEESKAERAETNEFYVSQGVDAFEVALDKSFPDIGKNKSEGSSGFNFQSKEKPFVGVTQSDTTEDSEIFLEQFAALGVDEESNENAEASSKKDKKKPPPTPIEAGLKTMDPPTGRSPTNKLRFDLRTPRQVAQFFSTLEPSDEAPVDEKRCFKSFKKLIAPAIEGEKPSIVDIAKIRQAAKRAKVPLDAVDQILEHAGGRQPITLPCRPSNESNEGARLGDTEEVGEEEAISAFLSPGNNKSDNSTRERTEYVLGSRSQVEVIQLLDVNSFDDKIEKMAHEDEDEDGEDEWWKVSRKEKETAKHAPNESIWDDASSTDSRATNGHYMEADDEDENVVDLTNAEDEVPNHAEDELPPSSRKADAPTPRGKGRNGITVESTLKYPRALSVETTPITSLTYDGSDDIGIWLRKSAMANYGTSWAKHKRWLSPNNASQLINPKPIDGVAAAENLNKIARRRKFLPADPWNRAYKERTKYHPGYFNVHVYSIYETSAADHGEPDELDFIPWEHRDVKQRFLQQKSIMFSRNWFGDLVRVRGNDKHRPPVCQPKSMEMPMENIPDPGEWTEEWYTTWKAPGNKHDITESHSGSEGSSVDEGSCTDGGSSSDDDSGNDRASNAGGDNTDDYDDGSWEEAPECGIIVNVKQKIGERVSRVHPDYTSSLRRSRWRRKYFPRGTFPY